MSCSGVKKVKAFLWNGVWTLDDDDLPLKGVKKKFIPKHRDILPDVNHDILSLIGDAVAAAREEATRTYHDQQHKIYRGVMSSAGEFVLGKKTRSVEEASARLHREVTKQLDGDDQVFKPPYYLKQVCDLHKDGNERGEEQYQYNLHQLKFKAKYTGSKHVKMTGWEWAGKGKGRGCSRCGVRGHTKGKCPAYFRKARWGQYPELDDTFPLCRGIKPAWGRDGDGRVLYKKQG